MDLTRAEVENALKKRGYLATEPQALDVICRAAHAWLTLEARVRELELEKETRYLASKKPREGTQK